MYLKDVKNGQVFYECERGHNIQWTALENPRRDPNDPDLVLLNAQRKDGSTMELASRIGFEHYLKLSEEPEYARLVNGKVVVVCD